MLLVERAVALGVVELVVPRIVVEETRNKYRETLSKAQQELLARVADLNVLLPADKQLAIEAADPEATVTDFISRFDARLAELGATRPDYDDISHGEVVGRDLQRRRPFQESGRGYRDTLLWETLLRKVASTESSTFLVTQNTKDFCSEDRSGNLHLHLVADLRARGLPGDAVKVCATLEAFVDEHLKPLLPTNAEVLAAIQNDEYDLFSFSEFFDRTRRDIGRQIERQLNSLHLPGWPTELLETPSVGYVEDPSSVDIAEAYEVEDDKVFLAYDVTANVDLDLFVYKPDFFWISERVPLDVQDREWSDHYVWASKVVTLPFRVSLVLKLGAPDKAESFEVELTEVFGWCQQCDAPIRSDAAETCGNCGADLFAPSRPRRRTARKQPD
jgi:PIN domain